MTRRRAVKRRHLLWVVILAGAALALGGCGGNEGPWPLPPGTISGITYDVATGNPTDVPIVLAVPQNEARAAGGNDATGGVCAYPTQAGTYTLSVHPGTYMVQCYVEHEGERYLGDSIEGVVVKAKKETSGQDLTAPSVITADTYSSEGDLLSVWFWLRDPGYASTSSWSFSGINRNRNIAAHFLMLVTNQINGGAGYDTTIEVTYSGNLGPTATTLYLPPSGSPPDNQYPPFPEGYESRTAQSVNQNYVTTTGDLDIDVKRLSPNPEHVATRSQSIWLINY